MSTPVVRDRASTSAESDGAAAAARERRRLTVHGLVQGVGFRPFVHRLAREHGLGGWVRNTGAGVEIEVEGDACDLDAFAARLRTEAPPLARVDGFDCRIHPPRGGGAFAIRESTAWAGELQPISPDSATCDACLAEVLDPLARRHGYPFTSCSDCGPRFTIIEELPYDRLRTTMRGFPLCGACQAEYSDPADRRFHAEPIACAACGPRLEQRAPGGAVDRASRNDPIRGAVAVLRAGRIVALKGLGGFQLACDATDDGAVMRLRERKSRDAKPFAVMVPDVDAARALCHVDPVEAAVLAGPRAPIVLLGRRPSAAGAPGVAPAVAPGLDTIGIMLPYTPLHHLLLRGFAGPLVMTSGNRSEEPIAAGNVEAEARLAAIADTFLLHDRDIALRCDDSVVRVDGGHEVALRRARGYAPEPIRLPRAAAAPILAVGPQLKNTFCLVSGDRAFLSPHTGDLDEAATLAHYHHTLALHRRLFGIEPRVVAHDLHPDYAATRYALSIEGALHVGVQHHHAHIASCLAEHGVTDAVIGAAFDGTGYGTDGAVWGGELLIADWRRFGRRAHLAYLPLPGGDAAAREPWRMAVAALALAFGDEADDVAARLLARISVARRRVVLQLAQSGIARAGGLESHAPPTSSGGRLFDAVAALAGIRDLNRYEGQAAMELEVRSDPSDASAYPLPLTARGTSDGATAAGSRDAADCAAVWDVAALIRAVVDDVRRGTAAATISARFHNALAGAVIEGCRWLRESEGLATVVLSGGCFQNRRLLTRTRAGLERAGFRVLTHQRVPPNDGGVSLGQAAVALAASDG